MKTYLASHRSPHEHLLVSGVQITTEKGKRRKCFKFDLFYSNVRLINVWEMRKCVSVWAPLKGTKYHYTLVASMYTQSNLILGTLLPNHLLTGTEYSLIWKNVYPGLQKDSFLSSKLTSRINFCEVTGCKIRSVFSGHVQKSLQNILAKLQPGTVNCTILNLIWSIFLFLLKVHERKSSDDFWDWYIDARTRGALWTHAFPQDFAINKQSALSIFRKYLLFLEEKSTL